MKRSPSWQEVQRAFYDSPAGAPHEDFQHANPYFDFVLRRFLDAVAPKPGERVLELGSSGGRFTLPLLEHGCRVTGVDLSAKAIEHLRRLASTHPQGQALKLVQDDAERLAGLPDRDFDAVVGAHILHHVDRLDEVAKRARERLRPGGRVVFVEPNPWNPQWAVQIAIHPGRSWRVERGVYRVWPGRVRRAFIDAGFDCRVETFGCFPPLVHNLFPGASRFERLLERLPALRRSFTLNVFVGQRR